MYTDAKRSRRSKGEIMQYIHPNSLSATVDSISEALFHSSEIAKSDRLKICRWIASRQGLPGSYANMFAPTKSDFENGIKVFTGETITSRASIAHILGEECCRILSILNVKDKQVEKAQSAAIEGFVSRLVEAEERGYGIGSYCCGNCSTAFWRNLLVTKLPKWEERLVEGMKVLKKVRLGDGRWRRFPFYYLSLTLTEIGPDLAKNEMKYAAPVWEKYLRTNRLSTSVFVQRRRKIGERLLELC